ncbi:MAG TPA: heme-binding protein [Geomonas sp.]|nr:heme-binding protein [Geomonas sp.]
MGVEEAPYTVIKTSGKFEIRDYAAHTLAEIIIDDSLEEAGKRAFRPLFNYISGANRSRNKISMTAPVSQQPAGEKIAMTAPVSQQAATGKWAISFMMPASYTLDMLPVPNDDRIKLREVPAHRVAAVRYSGTWSGKLFLRHKQELEAWLKETGLKAVGEPVWARYNPPFTPWFLRRNEILIPVSMSE